MSPALSMMSDASRRKSGVSPRTIAIVPAAGFGKRLGLKTKKPFALLDGKPLVAYALAALCASKAIDSIIIAVERSSVKRIKRLTNWYKFKKRIEVIIGGKTRFESVKNCLNRIGPYCDIVLIHDAARPFLEERFIKDSIRFAKRYGACIVAIPETDTVKIVDKRSFIKETLDRKRIFRAQTPQTFKYSLIKKAYNIKRRNMAVTDDASLVELLGKRVKIVEGSNRNIKITTKEDLKIAEVSI